MSYTAAQLGEIFNKNVPKTKNPAEFDMLMKLRDRLFSVAYRLLRDLPDGDEVEALVKGLVKAQRAGNALIQNRFKE